MPFLRIGRVSLIAAGVAVWLNPLSDAALQAQQSTNPTRTAVATAQGVLDRFGATTQNLGRTSQDAAKESTDEVFHRHYYSYRPAFYSSYRYYSPSYYYAPSYYAPSYYAPNYSYYAPRVHYCTPDYSYTYSAPAPSYYYTPPSYYYSPPSFSFYYGGFGFCPIGISLGFGGGPRVDLGNPTEPVQPGIEESNRPAQPNPAPRAEPRPVNPAPRVEPRPMNPAPANPAPMRQPAPKDGTFPYDGGPANPVPLPKVDPNNPPPEPMAPAPTDRSISLPAPSKNVKKKYTFAAYGEKPSAPEVVPPTLKPKQPNVYLTGGFR